MKKVTFYFVTGSGLVAQDVWVSKSLDLGDIGGYGFINNCHLSSNPNIPGRISINMQHVASWTYE